MKLRTIRDAGTAPAGCRLDCRTMRDARAASQAGADRNLQREKHRAGDGVSAPVQLDSREPEIPFPGAAFWAVERAID